ncbi:chemotaxis protein CheB [Aquabacterium sp.]|uniref:chemotaxis protein CheB n=1 Tax=Aquabacterium sp. TaxID=1872578 RepID=UPI0025B9EF49|nr:chemotaxis protein CheB [Aquabacterium sp.]
MTDSATLAPDQADASAETTGATPESASFLVALGASAGGLDALSRLFDHLPANTGAAFVVIQHLSAEHPTLMDTLLARHTAMPVVIAHEGDVCEPNRVLLIPPGKHISLLDGRVVLTPKPAHGIGLPIDEFLVSAAREWGERLVAVILSGTGSDGSRGIVRVSEWGGRVITQSPDSAEFDGMPVNALATGVVDHVLGPEEIAGLLGKTLASASSMAGAVHAELMQDPLSLAEDVVNTLNTISGVVRQYAGLDLEQYKPDMLLRRIRRRMQLLGIDSLLSYADLLVGNEAEAHQLRREVLIPVTRFFRDPETFEHLGEHILPKLLAEHPADKPFRVWVTATATGEEAYSLAMVLLEVCQRIRRWPTIKIYATDVEQRFLDVAAAGSYPESIEAEVSPERVARFFNRKDGRLVIKPDVRFLIVFARHNALSDPPFTRLNLVSCRNMLIYLRPPAQETVLRRLQFALVPKGILMLGRSESLSALERDFSVADSRARVYRLEHGGKPLVLPTGRQPFQADLRTAASPALQTAQFAQAQAQVMLQQLARQYAPPSVLIDDKRVVQHVVGNLGELLRLRGGPPSLDLLDLLPPELNPVVRALIRRLESEDGPVRSPALAWPPLPAEAEVPTLSPQGGLIVTASAFTAPPQPGRLILLSFEPAQRYISPLEAPEVLALSDPAREHVAQMERELTITRDSLQATIEELQTTNEELQATNEELMASNEELQSTNEELQSVNEELYSVNAEYQSKVKILGALNADLEGMSRAVGVPNLFVDDKLHLLRLTPETTVLFNLRDSDIGRSIEDFAHRLDYPEFFADLRRTMATGVTVEREVRSDDGRWHLARLLPYATDSLGNVGHNRAVASFVDITALRSASRLQAIVDAVPANLALIDAQGVILTVNKRWREFAEANGDRGLVHTGPGQNYLAVTAQAVASERGEAAQQMLAADQGVRQVLNGETEEFFQIYPCHAPDEARWFALHVTPLRLKGGGALVSHYNVSRWAPAVKEIVHEQSPDHPQGGGARPSA